MKTGFTKIIPVLIAGIVIGLACLFAILSRIASSVDFFERMELITYDWRMRAAANRNPYASTNLGFVAISDESIAEIADGLLGQKYGLYYPRHVYGRLVNELTMQGVKAIGFDVVFGEERPDHAPVLMADNTLIESDHFFTNVLGQSGNVILASTLDTVPPEIFQAHASALGDISVEKDSDGIIRRAKPYHDYRIWHPVIRSELRRLRFMSADKAQALQEEVLASLDSDGNFSYSDQNTKAKPYRDIRVWTMGIQLAARELDFDLEKTEIKPDAIVFHGKNGIQRTIPLNREGFFYIDWNLGVEDKRLLKQNIHIVLDDNQLRARGTNIPNAWSDKVVVVGSIATGNDLTDRGATPLKNDTFLVSKHWNIANSIIMGRYVNQTPLSVNLLILIFLGVISGFVTWRLRILPGTLAMIGIGALFVVVCWTCFVHQRIWIPIVLPAFGGLILPNVTLVAYRVIFEEKEKRRVRSIFSRLVSPNVVNELLSTENLKLGGSRRHITVYFADVRGFTEMTDNLQAKAEEFVKQQNLTGDVAEAYFDKSAAETLETVNLYLATIANTIKARGGTLDKYIGDCVMAFWGAPSSNDRHALDCVLAAIDAQRAMYALNQQRFAENKRREEENKTRVATGEFPLSMLPLLSLGSGINSGIAIVGMMGSEDHIINYTVFGREINLASRLEGLSGRGRIIIGETTYRELQRLDPDVARTCVELAPTMLKGFKQAVRNFEVPWKTAAPAPAGTQSTQPPAEQDKPAPAPLPIAGKPAETTAQASTSPNNASPGLSEPKQPEAAKL
ncbi:MAG: CHASE2 domain-containing protein [Opitutaceae bacterium]|nr:CHASE2 domain-containing protein [Verrucomicrobiales bacterium]